LARAVAENAGESLSIEDARFLVARLHGFENWDQLTEHIDR
jgi:hypothetical protein